MEHIFFTHLFIGLGVFFGGIVIGRISKLIELRQEQYAMFSRIYQTTFSKALSRTTAAFIMGIPQSVFDRMYRDYFEELSEACNRPESNGHASTNTNTTTEA